jgi:hypothetical protein
MGLSHARVSAKLRRDVVWHQAVCHVLTVCVVLCAWSGEVSVDRLKVALAAAAQSGKPHNVTPYHVDFAGQAGVTAVVVVGGQCQVMHRRAGAGY